MKFRITHLILIAFLSLPVLLFTGGNVAYNASANVPYSDFSDMFTGAAVDRTDGVKRIAVSVSGNVVLKETVSLNGFCASFVPQARQGTAELTLTANNLSVIFSFALSGSNFSGTAVFPDGQNAVFSNVNYIGEFVIQLRIGKESQIDFETGLVRQIWRVRVNAFNKDLEPLDAYAAEAFTADFESADGADIQNIGGFVFYDYDVISGRVRFEPAKINYESVTVSWNAPDGYNQNGYAVERFRNGRLEKRTEFTSGSISSCLEAKLDQSTEYVYRITAYDSLNIKNTPCPKVLFRLEDTSITTRAGNPLLAFGLVAGTVAVVAIVIVLYTLRFKIFKGKR